MTVEWTPAKIVQFKADVAADIRRKRPLIPEGWRWVMQMEWYGYDVELLDRLTASDDLRMPEPGFWIRRVSSDDA